MNFPKPVGPLGYLRILAPNAGVKVSPLSIGVMNLGQNWTGLLGTGANKEDSVKFLDIYRDAGGNFIDAANMYQDGKAEELLGEWMEDRDCRNEIVLATKYSYSSCPAKGTERGFLNFQGNNAKSMRISFESSLKRLRTDYIDIFYVHYWDYSTSIPEIMHALDTLVKERKVLYLGISDTPAWIVAKANGYAREKGLTPFTVYQGKWSLAHRDLEVEVIPMLRAEGMALVAWGTGGAGKFKTAKEFEEREKAGTFRQGQAPTDAERAVSAALEELAKELPGNPHPTAIAQAWALSKYPYVVPLLGGASPAQLESSIQSAELALTSAQIKKLEAVRPLELPFPYNMFGTDPTVEENGVHAAFAAFMPFVEFVRAPKALGPPGGVFKQ